MPLMREWTEITVDEDLLSSVVRELLDMAMDPNHVEVVYGTEGRVILAEVHLAEHWYLERLKKEEQKNESIGDTEVHASGFEVAAQSKVDETDTAQSTSVKGTEHLVPLPVKRGPGRPRNAPSPSASPDGEEP